jgi:DNA polymerase III subunit beta
MKFTCSAGALAGALATAASAVVPADTKRVAILGTVHIVADGETARLSVNTMDRYISTSCPASISHPGEVAVAVDRLAALAAGFVKDATVTLTSDDNALTVRCSRSNYKLPALPLEDLPATPCIGDAPVGQVELDHERALRILERPLFCVDTVRSRSYLNGIFLHAQSMSLLQLALMALDLPGLPFPQQAACRLIVGSSSR